MAVIFALIVIISCVAFKKSKEAQYYKNEYSNLFQANNDLYDKICCLKIKYGEIPMIPWIIEDENYE